MVNLEDIHEKINRLITPRFPQIKNIAITYEHKVNLIERIRFSSFHEEYDGGVLVFDVNLHQDSPFKPNLLSDIGNKIFLIMQMIYLDDQTKIRVTFNSLIAQSSFVNYL